MLQSTNQQELLQSQTNVEEQPKQNSSKLIEREPIENSPFTLIKNEKEEYFIVMGNYRITEIHNSKEEAITYLMRNTYNVILTMITIVHEKLKEMENNNNNNQKIQS